MEVFGYLKATKKQPFGGAGSIKVPCFKNKTEGVVDINQNKNQNKVLSVSVLQHEFRVIVAIRRKRAAHYARGNPRDEDDVGRFGGTWF